MSTDKWPHTDEPDDECMCDVCLAQTQALYRQLGGALNYPVASKYIQAPDGTQLRLDSFPDPE